MGQIIYRLKNGNREFPKDEQEFKEMQKKHPGSFVMVRRVKDGKEVTSAAVQAVKPQVKAPKPVKTGNK